MCKRCVKTKNFVFFMTSAMTSAKVFVWRRSCFLSYVKGLEYPPSKIKNMMNICDLSRKSMTSANDLRHWRKSCFCVCLGIKFFLCVDVRQDGNNRNLMVRHKWGIPPPRGVPPLADIRICF